MVLSLEPQHYYRSGSSPSAVLKIPTSIPTLGGLVVVVVVVVVGQSPTPLPQAPESQIRLFR